MASPRGQVGLAEYAAERQLASRAAEMVCRAACIEAVRAESVQPALTWLAAQDPAVTLASDPVGVARALLQQGGVLCGLLNMRRSDLAAGWTRLPASASITASDFVGPAARANVAQYLAALKEGMYFSDDELFDAPRLYAGDAGALERALALAEGEVRSIGRVRAVDYAAGVARLREADPLYRVPKSGPASGRPGGDESSRVGAPTNGMRCRVLQELLDTERVYVRDLGALEARAEAERAVLDAAAHRARYGNVRTLAAGQRVFLRLLERELRAETLSSEAATYDADVAGVFADRRGLGGAVADEHVVFCAGHAAAGDALEGADVGLRALLIKPIQRVCRYPLLLRDLIRRSAADAPDRAKLLGAQSLAEAVARRVNEAARKAENRRERALLLANVTDWRGLDADMLGELLLHCAGARFVAAGAPSRPHPTYLFENVLIIRAGPREPGGWARPLAKGDRRDWALKGHVLVSAIRDVRLGGGSPGAAESLAEIPLPGADEPEAPPGDPGARDVHIDYACDGRAATYTLRMPTKAVARMWVRVAAQRLAALAQGAPGLGAESEAVVTVPSAAVGGPGSGVPMGLPVGLPMGMGAAQSPRTSTGGSAAKSASAVPPPGSAKAQATGVVAVKVRVAPELFVALRADRADVASLSALRARVSARLSAAAPFLGPGVSLSDAGRLAHVDADGDAVALIDDDDLAAALAVSPSRLVLRIL